MRNRSSQTENRSSKLVARISQTENRSSKLVARSSQNTWGWTLIFICVLALAPALFANDDGEILDASIVLTVSPDFKVKEEVSITKRLLSYQALDADGDPRTLYCGDLQTLTITRARVTTPGGRVVDCTPNALNLSTPDALVAHPALSSWQEMVVTFLGLEPGARTELSYIREDNKAFRTTFEKKQILAWHFPIRKGTVTVRLPKDMKLTYQIMNFQGETSANAVADLMEYTFAFKDIPAFSDRDMHNGEAFLPTLYLTTTPSWEAAGKNLAEIAEKHGSPDEAIAKKAKELTKDAMTDLDKAIAIHKFVKERFAEVEWPLQDSLLLFNDASKTFAAGQGTNLELALILRAMISATGLTPKLILASPYRSYDQTLLPSLAEFNRVWVVAAGIAWEPSSPSEAYPDSWAIHEADTAYFPFVKAEGIRIDGVVELNKEDLKGVATLTFRGKMNPYWKNLEEKDALESATKAFLPFPGLKIEDTQVKALGADDTSIEIKFVGKVKEGDRTIRLLSETKTFLPSVDTRVTVTALPIRLQDTQVSIRWTVKGVGETTAPAWRVEGKWGDMAVVRTQDGSSLKVDAKMEIKEGLLPPADYPGLQAALAAWQNPVVAGVLIP